MELSKQDIELFLLFPDLWSKNFFYKKFLTFTMESKTGVEKRKWNYPNRKWNYFFYLITSNQKTFLPNVSYFYHWVQNWFWKREMELSKWEMELFLLLSDLRSKNFFYKMFLNFINEFKAGFENRKWNYPNRKWNYFSYFLTFDQKTSFTIYL